MPYFSITKKPHFKRLVKFCMTLYIACVVKKVVIAIFYWKQAMLCYKSGYSQSCVSLFFFSGPGVLHSTDITTSSQSRRVQTNTWDGGECK